MMKQKKTYLFDSAVIIEKAIFTLIKDSIPLSYDTEIHAHVKNNSGELEEVIISYKACF